MNFPVNSLHRIDIATTIHPFSDLVALQKDGPQIMSKGKGLYLYDDEGREYLDGCAGLWSVSLGYDEPRLVEAAAQQMSRLAYQHQFRNMSHEAGIELAETLLSMMPVKMSKVFFGLSGSDANDTVTKLVWYYNNGLNRPRKKKFIALMNGYHGVSVAAASLTGIQRNHAAFDLPIGHVRHADCPHFWRYGRSGETECEFAHRLADNLEALILREGPDTVAAFIAEPVQGAGGVIVPPAEYFRLIQPILHKHDILMIADEVICGFGRTGRMFGSETFDIEPDIITMAKALTSSYLPLSAVAVSDPFFQGILNASAEVGMFLHGYTYGAHPVCAAVALETLRIYKERDIVSQVNRVSPRFVMGLRALEEHPLVGEVRAIGLMAGIELVADKKNRSPFPSSQKIGAKVAEAALSRGLIVRAVGDTLVFSPSLTITEEQIDELVARFRAALDAVA